MYIQRRGSVGRRCDSEIPSGEPDSKDVRSHVGVCRVWNNGNAAYHFLAKSKYGTLTYLTKFFVYT